ncbi:MAG: hypothetical protein AAFY73_00140 [Pseudomonadota bacterium]
MKNTKAIIAGLAATLLLAACNPYAGSERIRGFSHNGKSYDIYSAFRSNSSRGTEEKVILLTEAGRSPADIGGFYVRATCVSDRVSPACLAKFREQLDNPPTPAKREENDGGDDY